MRPKNKKVIVIGAGFSGLSAAAFLSRQGYTVEVHEKNNEVGGRAKVLSEDGFVFDMGPSWYWMPGVAERFFNSFGKTASDFYELKKISPSFRMFFGKDDYWDVPSEPEEIQELFEKTEPGASGKFKEFMKEAGAKYETAMKEIIYHPGLSWTEYLNWPLFKGMWRYSLFTSFRSHIKKYFRHPRLLSLMEFPVLFLGASPDKIPALYSLLNYSGLMQGTWYPMGGMHKLVGAMREIAEANGASIHRGSEVDAFSMRDHAITHCSTSGRSLECDAVVASADYHHIEQKLLEKPFRRYSEKYWEKRTMAPSCLIFFLGVSRRIKNIQHHNLFFDHDIDKHINEIYNRPQWPTEPLFYASCPTKTDPSVAPDGCENLFLLMPVAPGLNDDSPEVREKYFQLLISRMEKLTGEEILPHIIYKKSYSISDFMADHHAYKGNAYGLANTLLQTGILKPSMRSSKVRNLFYAGQLTVPGPGVPTSIISGEIAANEVKKFLN